MDTKAIVEEDAKIINTDTGASMTVEASLVIPIFLFGIIAFLYFFQIFYVQEELQQAITETGKYASKIAFVYEYVKNEEASETKSSLPDTFDALSLKLKIQQLIDEDIINNSCILGGVNGIIMSGSSLKEKDMIDVTAVYRMRIPIPIFSIRHIPMVQRVRIRAFTGYKPSEEEGTIDDSMYSKEQIVYITDNGTVYHLNKECTHLKLSIIQLYFSDISEKRNESGGKYKPCEQCTKKMEQEDRCIVYITSYGNRYHKELSCSGLKRSIIEIPLSQIGDKPLCSRCGH